MEEEEPYRALKASNNDVSIDDNLSINHLLLKNEHLQYNNDNFYALNDDKNMQFQFSNTQPYAFNNVGKRPQSANIRVTKDKHNKNKQLKRNKNHFDYNYNGDEGVTTGSAPDVKAFVGNTDGYREPLVTNNSQFTRSPQKVQK